VKDPKLLECISNFTSKIKSLSILRKKNIYRPVGIISAQRYLQKYEFNILKKKHITVLQEG